LGGGGGGPPGLALPCTLGFLASPLATLNTVIRRLFLLRHILF
jgi:hypothetical protein